MKIGIDIDNVITNTTQCVLDYINERLNLNLQMKNINEYWLENCLPEKYGWIVEQAFHDSKMWKNVELLPGVRYFIEELYKEGHDIYFVTATTAENFRKKAGYLTREFDFFPEGYVRQHSVSIKKKQLLNLDILIDDYLDNLIGERSYISILLNYPWNQSTDKGDMRLIRCNSWTEIFETILKIEKKYYG